MIAATFLVVAGVLSNTDQVSAHPSRDQNVYYDYPTTATVVGTWGANLFEGNDQNKVFQRVLPVNSQWQVYGYTWRDDGYYYYAGGNLWIQGNQIKTPVYNWLDAILNVVSRYGEDWNSNTRWRTTTPFLGPIEVALEDDTNGQAIDTRLYQVFDNGDINDVTWAVQPH